MAVHDRHEQPLVSLVTVGFLGVSYINIELRFREFQLNHPLLSGRDGRKLRPV